MPAYKSHHFVPRCYLKPFSIDQIGRAINLLNIPSSRVISNAPIKGQCAKDRLYSEFLEQRLGSVEGQYAQIVKKICEEDRVQAEELAFLRDFSLLQYLRTDFAARRQALASEDMENLIFEGPAEEQRPPPIPLEMIARESIVIFIEIVDYISDLKVRIIRNQTGIPFITSDDPSIQVNRFLSQRGGQRIKAGGLKSAGLLFFLPISPKHQLVSYDGNVYTCPDHVNNLIDIKSDSDIIALNTLQAIKANQNLYFADHKDADQIQESLKEAFSRRPRVWHKLHYAVRDEQVQHEGSVRYRVVHTQAERSASTESLIHLEIVPLEPGAWFSKIKFRSKPIFFDTKTGEGLVRPRFKKDMH